MGTLARVDGGRHEGNDAVQLKTEMPHGKEKLNGRPDD